MGVVFAVLFLFFVLPTALAKEKYVKYQDGKRASAYNAIKSRIVNEEIEFEMRQSIRRMSVSALYGELNDNLIGIFGHDFRWRDFPLSLAAGYCERRRGESWMVDPYNWVLPLLMSKRGLLPSDIFTNGVWRGGPYPLFKNGRISTSEFTTNLVKELEKNLNAAGVTDLCFILTNLHGPTYRLAQKPGNTYLRM